MLRLSYKFWVDYFVSGQVGAESIDIEIYWDGRVQMNPAIVDFVTWTNNGPNPDGYACDLGSSFSIVAPSNGKSHPVSLLWTFFMMSNAILLFSVPELTTHEDYASVVAALKEGREMELVIDLSQCTGSFPDVEERDETIERSENVN
jgi:hypothetical protein